MSVGSWGPEIWGLSKVGELGLWRWNEYDRLSGEAKEGKKLFSLAR